MKACHDALQVEPFWSNLRPDGFMTDPSSTSHVFELRRCPQCGSSLAKRVARASVFRVLREISGVLSRSLDALAIHAPRGQGSNTHA